MWVKKLKNKIVMEIVLVVLLVIVVAFSGCIEEETLHPETTDTGEVKVIPPMPTIQNINGNYKVQEVSGDTININGNYNEIRILNADVSLIRVNGNYNTVYYPKEAIPMIRENGNGNEIETY